jgi:hypothetical protein
MEQLTNWLERVKLHFGPDFHVSGSGRYCLTTVDDPNQGYLYETYDEARRQIAKPERCRVIDLVAKTMMEKLEAMPDRYPD